MDALPALESRNRPRRRALSLARTARQAGQPRGGAMTLNNMRAVRVLALIAVMGVTTVRAETPDEWIALGARVHGGFGSFIPVGIRIGLDALQRLNAKPREVTVVYYDSDKAPCACVADGIAIATVASVGQRTLQIASEKAPDDPMAVIVIRKKQTGEAVKYTIDESWLPKLAEWNKTLDTKGRYDQVMKADGLFEVTPSK
jgi:FmdE, Molybdenum formylmethanofuran dehydrogenase operon